jgi:hypothetical protein
MTFVSMGHESRVTGKRALLSRSYSAIRKRNETNASPPCGARIDLLDETQRKCVISIACKSTDEYVPR